MVSKLFSPNNQLFLTCLLLRLDFIHLSKAEISLQLQHAGVTQAAETLVYIPERKSKIWHLGYWDTYLLGYSWDFPFCQVFYVVFQKTGQGSASLSSRKALLEAEAATGGSTECLPTLRLSPGESTGQEGQHRLA